MPHPGRGERLSRLEMEIEARGVHVLAPAVAEVQPDVGLVRALVFGEPDVPVDPEQRAARGTVVRDELGADLPQVAGEAPDELQGRLLHHVDVPLLVLGEPGAIVVLAKVLQKPEQVRSEQSLSHSWDQHYSP